MFESRGDWADHEKFNHRAVWRCPGHPNDSHLTEDDYITHVKVQHSEYEKELISREGMLSVISTNQNNDRACPFCYIFKPTAREMEAHVLFHLEDIALLALPRATGFEKGGAQGDTASTKLNVSTKSVAQDLGPWSNAEDDTDESNHGYDQDVHRESFSPLRERLTREKLEIATNYDDVADLIQLWRDGGDSQKNDENASESHEVSKPMPLFPKASETRFDKFNLSSIPPFLWRDAFGSSAPPTRDESRVFKRLIMFDTVFILDDSGSMYQPLDPQKPTGTNRWEAAKEALKHTGGIAISYDPDGIDLRFLNDDKTAYNITNVEDLFDILDSAGVDELGGGTFFMERLEDIISPRLEAYRAFNQQLELYKMELDRRGGDKKVTAAADFTRPVKPKNLNLIVVTDGAADDAQEVEEYIVEVAKELDDLKAPDSQIGIQFVQVGDDINAARFLVRLDDELMHQRDPPVRNVSSIQSENPIYNC